MPYMPKSQMEAIVADRLEKVHLLHAFHKFPGEISGGMKKRAALARAIALKPELLFCDEPSTGLDPVTARSLDELLLELRDTLGVSMVIVSHELESIKIVCDRFVYLKDGYVLKDATLKEGMESDDPVLRHFFNRQCPKENNATDFYNFEFID
jgi:phospholipid/cholesterol/gamma-HCH transport system ATP-binding protein